MWCTAQVSAARILARPLQLYMDMLAWSGVEDVHPQPFSSIPLGMMIDAIKLKRAFWSTPSFVTCQYCCSIFAR